MRTCRCCDRPAEGPFCDELCREYERELAVYLESNRHAPPPPWLIRRRCEAIRLATTRKEPKRESWTAPELPDPFPMLAE